MRPLKLEWGAQEEAWLLDLALYLPRPRALVIADLHLGYEEALNEDGVLVPRAHLERIEERLQLILNALARSGERPRLVAINGDLKHHFGPLSPQEWHEARELLRFLTDRAEELVLIEGNHDTNLEYLLEKTGQARLVKHLKLDRTLLIHGDVVPPAELLRDTEALIIGHEHPAVGLRNRVTGRVEVFKAFLLGRWEGRRLLIQPSFNLLIKGTDLTQETTISPLLSADSLERFQVFLVSDEGGIYHFGLLRALLG